MVVASVVVVALSPLLSLLSLSMWMASVAARHPLAGCEEAQAGEEVEEVEVVVAVLSSPMV